VKSFSITQISFSRVGELLNLTGCRLGQAKVRESLTKSLEEIERQRFLFHKRVTDQSTLYANKKRK
jgi:hypothetical protein